MSWRGRRSVSRDAVEDVRARVMKERDARRKLMIERLEGVNIDKLDRRPVSRRSGARRGDVGAVAQGAGGAAADPIPPAARRDERGGPHVCARAAARGSHRRQEAPLRAGARRRQRPASRRPARPHDQARAGHARKAARSAGAANARRRGAGRAAHRAAPSRVALEDLARTSRISAAICTDATWPRRSPCARPHWPSARSLFRSWRTPTRAGRARSR